MSLSYKRNKDFDYIIAYNKIDGVSKPIYYYFNDCSLSDGMGNTPGPVKPGGPNELFKSISGDITLNPFVEKNQRFSAFISGASGSGKSTLASNLVKKLHKKDKKKVILITSSSIRDPAFEEDYIHMFSPDELLERDAWLEDFGNEDESYNIIFDDYMANSTKEVNQYVNNLLTAVLKLTRKVGISVFVLTHVTRNGNETKDSIYECNHAFITMLDRDNVKKYCKLKLGWSEKNTQTRIDELKSSRFDFFYYCKIPPFYGNEKKICAL